MSHSLAEFRRFLGARAAHYTEVQLRKALDGAYGRTSSSIAPHDASLLDLPDIRQPDDFGCGACAAKATAEYLGVPERPLKAWYKALGTDVENSTRPQAIIDYLSELGLQVEPRQHMTIDDLRECWQAGKPVICPIQEYGIPSKQASFDYGHYCVCIGVGLGHIFVFDPSIDNVLEGEDADQAPGRMLIDEKKWLEVWHDKDSDGNKYVRFGIVVGPPAVGFNRITHLTKAHTNGHGDSTERASEKGLITRDDFGYAAPPDDEDYPHFAQCVTCWKWTGRSCLEFGPEDRVLAGGACDFYSLGKPIGEQGVGHESGGTTPEAAGYVERDVRCQNCGRANETATKCLFYEELNQKDTKRFALDTAVEPQACCNAQTPKEKQTVTKALWESNKHPRGGDPHNPGRFSRGGVAGAAVEQTKPYPPPDAAASYPSFPGEPGAKSPPASAATRNTGELHRPTPADYMDDETEDSSSPSSASEQSSLHQSLERARMTRAGNLSSGINQSLLLTLEDGTQGVFKPEKGEKYAPRTAWRREIAASRVADLLGLSDLVPATTVRHQRGEGVGSIQAFVPGALEAASKDVLEPFDGHKDAVRAAVFDYLMGNVDRHFGNWLVKNGQIVLIDNGAALPDAKQSRFVPQPLFWVRAVQADLRLPDLSSWKNKWGDVEEILRDCGIEDKAMLLCQRRFNALLENKSGRFADLPWMGFESEGSVGKRIKKMYPQK